jgi:hypothetical protein
MDYCAMFLTNELFDFEINAMTLEDPKMRKANRIDVILTEGIANVEGR